MDEEFDTFVAYSRRNQRFVDKLVEDLREHHIRVWVDTLEIKTGEQFRARIEDGIERSRYFCLIVSDAALESYYVRRVELESAFVKMERSGSGSFVLPLLWRCTQQLPLQLSTYQYLDFRRPDKYTDALRALVDHITLDEGSLTGIRLYKNVDTSMRGTMVGVGEPLRQLPFRGAGVRVFYDDGLIQTMETYTDGAPDGTKYVRYDLRRRVAEITLFRDNRVIDSWRYEYDESTGLRKFKWVCRPGEKPHLRLAYDPRGNKLEEINVDGKGEPMDVGGWAVKLYVRDPSGQLSHYELFDSGGEKVATERA